MKYGVQVKFVDFGGKTVEKELAVNNTRAGNLLFTTHKSYPDTLSVRLIEKETGHIINQWSRT